LWPDYRRLFRIVAKWVRSIEAGQRLRNFIFVPVPSILGAAVDDAGEDDGDLGRSTCGDETLAALEGGVETVRSVEGAPWYEVSIADIDDYEGRVWAEGKGALRSEAGAKPEDK
jgi:hypothetical protein